MANYTPTTAFGPKDALANGDPAKVILGTEIDTEYDNIATAIATKVDSSAGIPTLSSNNAWTGSNKFSGAASPLSGAGGVALGTRSSTGAIIDWYDSTEGADLKDWFAYTSSGAFIMGAGDDAGTSSENFLNVTRSTYHITGIILGNATDKPAITVAGPATFLPPANSSLGLTVINPASGSGQSQIAGFTNGVDADLNVCISQTTATTKYALLTPGVNIPLRLSGGISGGVTAGIQGYGPSSTTYVDMTPDQGTFTGTPTGVSSGGPFLCTWYRIGHSVTLVITNPNTICTSNGSSFTMFGLPTALQPTSIQVQDVPLASSWLNGGSSGNNSGARISASSTTISFFVSGSLTGWVTSSTKGPSGSGAISYVLQYLAI